MKHSLTRGLIYWIVFYAVSAIFQPYNGDQWLIFQKSINSAEFMRVGSIMGMRIKLT